MMLKKAIIFSPVFPLPRFSLLLSSSPLKKQAKPNTVGFFPLTLVHKT